MKLKMRLLAFLLVLVTAFSFVLPANAANDDGLVVNKSVSSDGDGTYTLTLEAYATGETVTNQYVKPADIVMVMDQSCSMLVKADETKLTATDLDWEKAKIPGYYIVDGRINGTGEGNWYYIYYTGNPNDGTGRWNFEKIVMGTTTNLIGAYPGEWPVYGLAGYNTSSPDFQYFQRSDIGSGLNDDIYVTRFGAMYDAALAFADSISQKGVDHRVSIIGFSGGVQANEYFTAHTGNYVFNGSSYQQYGTLNYSVYANSLKSVNTPAGASAIKASLAALCSNYWSTQISTGIEMANNVFEATKSGYNSAQRSRMIVLFTDGDPTDGRAAIDQAKIAKNNYGASVYTIGYTGVSEGTKSFLSQVSSNYLNSTSSSAGSQTSSKYALYASNATELKNAFGKISEDVSSTTVTLDSTTIMRDIVTSQFDIDPSAISNTGNIKVYTQAYKGNGTWNSTLTPLSGASVTVSKSNGSTKYNTVNVTGYNYKNNFIHEAGANTSAGGNKLVVKIPIQPTPDFLGGNGVLTNATGSGIYKADGTLVKAFVNPTINVQVKSITPQFKNGEIYVSQEAELPHIANIGYFKVGSTTYTLDGINNAYVDIKYTIKDGSNYMSTTIPAGTKLSNLNLSSLTWTKSGTINEKQVLTADKQYQVTCEVISKSNTSNKSTSTGNPYIYVYKPVITFKDSEMNLGQTADYDKNNYGATHIVWKHGNTVANTTNMGAAPTLVYTYSPAEAAFTKETNVTVKAVTAQKNTTGSLKHNVPKNMDIIDYVTFVREACTTVGCAHTSTQTFTANASRTQTNFVVHLKTFDLVISKQIKNTTGYSDANQKFLFKITGPNNFSMNVSLSGGESVTIKSLPAGVYTVTELTGWSWRYDATQASKQVSSANVNANGVVTTSFENTRQRIYWLSGENFWRNLFNGRTQTPAPTPTPKN